MPFSRAADPRQPPVLVRFQAIDKAPVGQGDRFEHDPLSQNLVRKAAAAHDLPVEGQCDQVERRPADFHADRERSVRIELDGSGGLPRAATDNVLPAQEPCFQGPVEGVRDRLRRKPGDLGFRERPGAAR